MNKELGLVLYCDEKQEARKLRILPTSFRDIAKKLNISASSARNYCMGIELTKEQKEELWLNRGRKIKKTIIINDKIDNIEIIGKIKIKYPAKNKSFNLKQFVISALEKYTD